MSSYVETSQNSPVGKRSEPLNEAFPIIAESPGAKIGEPGGQPALLVREPGGFIFRLELKVD
jgi:hypothetical protein